MSPGRKRRSCGVQTTKKEEFARLLPCGAKPDVIGETDTEMTWSSNYFNSYGHFSIHEDMLKDEVRNDTYKRAILGNPHLFQGKTILDVGCGTAILSCFAAEAGARKVYAVDYSSIADQARTIIADNGYEGIVEVIESTVEDLVLMEKVDVIISEWMGFFLFAENMLQSVLLARDKWLKPGGVMLPDKAELYLCAIEDAVDRADRIDFWDNVYGLDMTCIKSFVMTEPLADTVDEQKVITTGDKIFSVDLDTVTVRELSFVAPFRLKALRHDKAHAFVGYFCVKFSHGKEPVSLFTSPHKKKTHWEQSVFFMDKPLRIERDEEITGTLACRPNRKNRRDLDIAIEYKFKGRHAARAKVLRYRMR